MLDSTMKIESPTCRSTIAHDFMPTFSNGCNRVADCNFRHNLLKMRQVEQMFRDETALRSGQRNVAPVLTP